MPIDLKSVLILNNLVLLHHFANKAAEIPLDLFARQHFPRQLHGTIFVD